MKINTKKNLDKFLAKHAELKDGYKNIYTVIKPIKGWKKIWTYPERLEAKFKYNPHADMSKIEKQFIKHYKLWRFNRSEQALMSLVVPEGALIQVHYGYKDGKEIEVYLRADRIDDTLIRRVSDGKNVVYGYSMYDPNFSYGNMAMIGEGIYSEPSEPFCMDDGDHCASGLHFVLTEKEALEQNV